MIKWLDSEPDLADGTTFYYHLVKAKNRYEVRKICNEAWLILNWDALHHKERLFLRFAVLQQYSSDISGESIQTKCVFHGEGFSGNLRECRHTWWGENGEGYIFFPRAMVIKAALEMLGEFFDL